MSGSTNTNEMPGSMPPASTTSTDAKGNLNVPSEKPTSANLHPPPASSTSTSSRPQSNRPSVDKRESIIDRALSQANRNTAKQFFSAYAETWIGMSPIWLMGEAIIPGKRVGTRFKKGVGHLRSAGEELAAAIATSSQDIVVIVDEKVRSATDSTERGKTAEVLKAAGNNAILLVTTSLENATAQIKGEHGDKIKAQIQKTIRTNGRDVVVLVDKTLRNPVVITGVAKFARSKGIPHAEALLRLASLGLAKILQEFPEADLEGVRNMENEVEELDAEVLSERAGKPARDQAESAGKAGRGEPPKMQEVPANQDPYEKLRKDNQCIAM